MKNGYYLVKAKVHSSDLAAAIGHLVTGAPVEDAMSAFDIASYDAGTNSFTFVGDFVDYPADRYEVIRYICDPHCTELRK